MAIEYRITLDDQHQLNYRIELERHYDPQAAAAAPRWTRLNTIAAATARSIANATAIVRRRSTCMG